MKKLLVILVAIAASALVMSQYSKPAAAEGGDGIPLEKLAGKYSSTAQGSLSVCLDKTKLFAKPPVIAVIDCGNAKEIAIPQNFLFAGEVTRDEAGNSCSTYTVVQASLPVDDTPPLVFVARHNVSTVTSYDASTGTGDFSTTNYVGGTCNGSTFDNMGTAIGTSKSHVVASGGGRRIDFVVTSDISYVTDTTGNLIGDFSISGTQLKQ